MFCLVFYKQVLIDYLFLTIGDAFFTIKTLSNLVSYSSNSRLYEHIIKSSKNLRNVFDLLNLNVYFSILRKK